MRSPTFLKALAVASAYVVDSAAGDCVCPVDGVMMVGVQEIQYVQDGVTSTATSTMSWQVHSYNLLHVLQNRPY